MEMILMMTFCLCLLYLVPNKALDTKARWNGVTSYGPAVHQCLTGYMTDVQSWVDENGSLTKAAEPQITIDASATLNVVPVIYQMMNGIQGRSRSPVRFLSMANCKLNRVPTVFRLKDPQGRPLSTTVEYVTLYGNVFVDISSPGVQYNMVMNATGAIEMDNTFATSRHGSSAWSAGFQGILFPQLRELDLRRCSIQILSDNLFGGMPELEALYLGENCITYISSDTFVGLANLLHLDLSRNLENNDSANLVLENSNVFGNLKNLTSLDLSFTKLQQRNMEALRSLGKSMQRLSLCEAGLTRLGEGIFNTTSLKYLDISGNSGIIPDSNRLRGLENTLQVLYAEEIGLRSFKVFDRFKKLEILKLKNNEISLIHYKVAKTLYNLKILDMSENRLTSWFVPTVINMPRLQLLSLKDNTINLVSEDMIIDFQNIKYLSLSGNFIVCNCHTREFFELALKNENSTHYLIESRNSSSESNRFVYHTGFKDFNRMIKDRRKVTRDCNTSSCDAEPEKYGNFVLLDFHPTAYECLLVSEGKNIEFSKVQTCQSTKRDIDLEDRIAETWNKLLLLILIPGILFPLLIFGYVFRRNFKYFCITIRNSATLSLINKNEVVDETTIFNYDVFVSYCNEDRNWVLDYLLPHVEKNDNVCVCLHERDFQVGLSILENIVSCMDRSRSILLILSQQFLMSRWCQFEMHLAQHRLLETRREDLILVLLEDIPRRMRPTTLQYLMLTKTYIVWPKEESEQPLFWRRLKKSFTQRLRQPENTSLA